MNPGRHAGPDEVPRPTDATPAPCRGGAAPAGGPIRRTVKVANSLGLHFRPAHVFSELAKRSGSAVTVWHGSNKADGKSMIELILLVALPGSELVLEVDGPDAADVVGPLADVLAAPGDS